MIRIGSRSLLAVAAAAIAMLWWSGCATTSRSAPEEDYWTKTAEDVSECCPMPDGAVGTRNDAAPDECWLDDGDSLVNGYRTKGKAWLHPATGEYCAEEGAAVRFPEGPWIEGPSEGNYYEEQQNAFTCCPIPKGAWAGSRGLPGECFAYFKDANIVNDNGYMTQGPAWLHKTTGEYCAEENGAVRFPGGDWIPGPSTGNYYE